MNDEEKLDKIRQHIDDVENRKDVMFVYNSY